MSLNPFKADPQQALERARNKLSAVESNIAELQATRAAALVDSDGPEDVLKIDAAIRAERANLEIYKDKIKALQEEVRRVTYEERESQRKKAIGEIKPGLKKREATAAALQEAIERVGQLYEQLVTRDELDQFWPFGLPHAFMDIDRRSIDRECSWALYGLTKVHGLPEPGSVGLGVAGIRAEGIDGAIKNQNEAIVSRLEMLPLHGDLLDGAING